MVVLTFAGKSEGLRRITIPSPRRTCGTGDFSGARPARAARGF